MDNEFTKNEPESGREGGGEAETPDAAEQASVPDTGDGGNNATDDTQAEEISVAPAIAVETETEETQAPALPYPIVGFGASAGGLQAFKEVLENLDPNTGMSFVLVTHLAPDQKSFLSEIIERYTHMPVSSIENGQRPEPNHVYVLLPNQWLTLRGGQFRIDTPGHGERFPKTIDRFFHSLAADQKNHAIGVVLSGADADGALGLKAIKGEGGIALVQSPDSATHSGMPRSSIAADHVDLVIPPGEIAVELGRLAHQFARPEVVESVPVPIVVLNEECTIRTENTAFRQLTQLQVKELEGMSLPDIVAHLWGLHDLRERLNELVKSRQGATIEFEHESTSAQKKTLLVKGRVLSTDGSRVLLLMIEDITLRRESEMLMARQKHALEGEIAVAARKLNRSQDELRGLNAHLFKAQEEERQRVARELHDDISQRLSLLEMLLHDVRLEDATADNRTKIKSAQEQIQAINPDVRQISHRLHPAILNDLGLSAALKALVTEFGERENMPATYVTQNLPESWSPLTATSIYRITQEALRNVAKHAGKTHVKVVLAGEGDRLQLKVMDFGIGFDQEMETQSPGLGMISMQERARLAGGTMNIASKLGEGTTVSVDLPVRQNG